MKLYDTLTRSLKDFDLSKDQPVKIYTCGPTVYDYPHIGNWYAFIRWDILVRMLLASGYKVDWVMNITDVGHLVSDADEGEDKLQKGARREGKTASEIADFYTNYFLKGLKRLNFIKPNHLPKATDFIPQQIEFIKGLEAKGFTYQIDDGVYFDTSKVKDYGQLAKLDVESLKAGARVEYNKQKRNPTDFALWKFSPKDQKRDMEWNSPWGKGFPGWHIECSTIAKEILGDSIDIHAGGIDHLPVHHPNEIAQSESLTGKPLAKFWLHSNFAQVDGKKMSKSLGNLITLEDIEAKGYSLEAFRLLVLESHYRSEAQFTWDTLAAAQNRLNNYHSFADLRFQTINPDNYEIGELDYTEYGKIITSSLQNDLDTPKALSNLNLVVDKRADAILDNEKQEFNDFIKLIDNLLGLNLLKSVDIMDEQKQLIKQREEARKNNDWTTSDKIRAQLKEQGIELRDTTYGPIWNR